MDDRYWTLWPLDRVADENAARPSSGVRHGGASARGRLLASVKQLAVVRKLLKPGLSAWEVAMGATGAGRPDAGPPTGRRPAPRLAAVN